VSRHGMPYQVKAGSVTAVVANEKQALEMLRRMVTSGKQEVSITDILGDQIDAATLETRLNELEPKRL
jgi:hypothetical protein